MPFTVHATQKLLARAKRSAGPGVEGSTMMGPWYANIIAWRSPLVLLVNERTLLPVLMPLAPSASLESRLPAAITEVLRMHGVPDWFVEAEAEQMSEVRWAKTANRSTTGVMVEFAFMMEHSRAAGGDRDLLDTARWLAHTPCSPLYKSHTFPDRALTALVQEQQPGR